MSQLPYIFATGGALDLVTAPIAMKPGRLIAAKNYEATMKGYHRVDGYEAYDGRLQPSLAGYWVLAFDGGIAAIVTGNTITGHTSGATAIW